MPATVGRYRIDRVLGSGAFASVWLAHDEVLRAQVAVKVLAGGLIDDLDVRNRFLEEARILRRADSERLVRVHDIGTLEDGRPYFVMSYADRGTLADRMRGGVLPVGEALRLAVEVAYGVEVINRLGVIHRDLKPSNVLFQSTTDGGERLLITDLGLAKALAHASGAFTLPVGTPGYMPPEQARFGGGLDVRADVYGLGALTYHLVTGRAPSTAPVMVPPSAIRPGLPPAVDQIVMRAMDMDRERRWPSADAFGAALAASIRSLPPDGEAMRVPPHERTARIGLPEPESSAEQTIVDLPLGRPERPGGAAVHAGDTLRAKVLAATGLAAVLVGCGGGAYGIAKLAGAGDGSPQQGDDLTSVTDTTGKLNLRVPPAWKPQPQHDHWPVPVRDQATAPALRATPDYGRFVRDNVAVPGVFAGVTHDLTVALPPRTLGSHQTHCTPGAVRPYRHGSLSGRITPWACGGSITINEVGLRDAAGKFAMWVRIKQTGAPDLTQRILNSIRVRG